MQLLHISKLLQDNKPKFSLSTPLEKEHGNRTIRASLALCLLFYPEGPQLGILHRKLRASSKDGQFWVSPEDTKWSALRAWLERNPMTGRNTKHRCKQLRKLHQITLDPTIPGYTGTERKDSHQEAVNNMMGLLFRCMEIPNSAPIRPQYFGLLDGQATSKAELLLAFLGLSTLNKAEANIHVSSGAQATLDVIHHLSKTTSQRQ